MVRESLQPIYILPENTQRTTGKSAQKTNLEVAKSVAETVRTTLGPKGMDKLIVNSLGEITVTNDGVTILEEMKVEHPIAKIMVNISRTQENEIGDGTTTAVMLAGELLKKAELLLEQNIHPTVIAKGYRIASNKCLEILGELGEDVSIGDDDLLLKIGMTAITGKNAEISKEHLAKLSVMASKSIIDKGSYDRNDIRFQKVNGGSVEDSYLIDGLVLDKTRSNAITPHQVSNAKILLLDYSLEVKNPEMTSNISISNPSQLKDFLNQENEIIKEVITKVVSSGCNVVFCSRGISDLAFHLLAKSGVLAFCRVRKSDLEFLSKTSKAKIVSNIDDCSSNDLGFAGIVKQEKFNDSELVLVQDCKDSKMASIIVNGSTIQVVDEVKRSLTDSIGDILSSLKSGKIVGGAGSIEIELSKRLRLFANSIKGKEQLAVCSFADSLEIIPKTLAENAGLDSVDLLTELKSKHEVESNKWLGVNVLAGGLMDAWVEGVIEPLKIKTVAINSASEVSQMILRIDDVILSDSGSKSGKSDIDINSLRENY